jgi:hypothetical protein
MIYVGLPTISRTFKRWCGEPLSFTFGGKPVIDRDGTPVFAELAIMLDMRAAGWDAVWTEAFGHLRFWQTMPTSWKAKSDATLPPELQTLIRRIVQKAGNTAACLDVVAWRGDEILFCEAKQHGKDHLTSPQKQFIKGALDCGLTRDNFQMVEWHFEPACEERGVA